MPDIAGNTLGTATPLNLTSNVQIFPDTVTPTANDYYRFNLSNRSSFNLSLTNLNADANVALLDSAGNLLSINGALQNSANPGTFAESINTVLDAGTYYIQVASGGSTTSADYALNVAISNTLNSNILWRNYSTGQNVVWLMNGVSLSASASVTAVSDLNWKIQGAGDFNQDGQTDILWRNSSTGNNSVWLMNGLTFITSIAITAVADSNWQIQGTGDFDGDNKLDIVWRNYSSGKNSVWLMNGLTLTTSIAVPAVADPNWKIQGVSDFNGDSKPDLLWRNYSTGKNSVWFMNGLTFLTTAAISAVPDSNWQIQGTGDFNGDNKSDILWRNSSTGKNSIWLMNGLTFSSSIPLSQVSNLSWRALSPFITTGTPSPIDIAGNTLPNAFKIGSNLSGSATYRDAIGGTDTNDYYQFSLGTASNVALSLAGLAANLDLRLLDSNGVVLQSSTLGSTTSESISSTLSAGTYYIQVYPVGSSSSTYALNLAVNNLPVLVTRSSLAVTEGTAATISNSILRVTDNDNTPAQLTYTLGNLPTKGNLLLNGTTLVSGATFTQADIDSDNNLRYQHDGSETLTDVFSFTVADGAGGTLSTNTLDIAITPANDAPVITLPAGNFSADQGANSAISGITIADPDAGNSNVRVTLSAVNGVLSLGFKAGLTFSQGTGSQDATMIFSGNLSDINTALSSLVYRSNSTFKGIDTIAVNVNDNGNTGVGGALSDSRSLAITVTPINKPPIITLPPAQIASEDTSLTISGISISDIDGNGGNVTVSVSAVNGVISLNSTSGITLLTGTGSQDRNLTFTGTLASVNAVLNSLAYLGSKDFNGADLITIEVNDSVSTGSGGIPLSDVKTLAVTVNPVNDAPVLTVPGEQAANENTNARITGVSVNDVDAGSSNVTVNLSAGNGTLSLTSITGLSFTSGNGNQNTNMVFSGTLAAVNSALNSLVYKSNPNFNGTDTVNVSVNDNGNTGAGIALSDSKSIAVNVLGVNNPPVITVPLAPAANSGTNLAIVGVSIADPDAGGALMQVTIAAANGVLSLPTTGLTLLQGNGNQNSRITFEGTLAAINSALANLVYRSFIGFTGFETISISANDEGNSGIGTPLSDTKTLFINVGGAINNPPAANNDTYSILRNGTLTVPGTGVLGNDVDTDSPSLNANLVDLPTHGNLSFSSTGSFTYTPNANFVGTDTFTYRATDGIANSNLATVTIAVTAPINDAPVANQDSFSFNEDTPYNNNVLLNDTDTEDTRPQSAQLITGPTQALSFSLNADGSFNYTPAANFNGNDSFTYIAKDSTGASSGTATVNLTINPVNDAPVAVNDSFPAFDEDTPFNGNVLLNDTDTEDTRPQTATLAGGPGHALSFSLNTDGSFSYTPAANFNGNDSFTYIAKDSTGASSGTATVNLTVTPVNDAPVAVNDNFTVSAGSTLSNSVLTNDSDVEDTRPQTAVLAGGPTNAQSFTLNTDGTFTYVPNTGGTTDSFTYVATDSAGGTSNTATVSINVSSLPNTPPIAVNDSFPAFDEDTPFNGNVLLNDTDTEDTRPQTATLAGGPGHALSFSLNTDGSFSYTPAANFNGNDSFTYIAKDSTGASSGTATVNLTVTPVNDAPVAVNDNFTVSAGSTLSNSVLTNDSDVEDTRPQTAVLAGGPTNAQSFTLNTDGTFTYVPNTGGTTDSFTYVATDSAGGTSNTATVSINVSSLPNTPPIAVNDSFPAFDEDTPFNGNVLLNDTDTEDTRPQTATLAGGPGHALSFSLNTDGSFSYTPAANFNGNDSFTYIAKDSTGASSGTATVNLTVTPVNDAPVAVNDNFTVSAGSTLSNSVLTNDSDVEDTRPQTAVLAGGPTNAQSFTLNTDGTFTYVPNTGGTTDSFTYVATDSAGGTSNTATVSINVSSLPNTPPIAVNDSFPAFDEDTPFNGNVLLNDTDTEDTRPQTATLAGGPGHALSFSLNTDGSFSYTPAANFNGNDSFTYIAKDSTGASSGTATVNLTINPVNDAPVAVNDSFPAFDEDTPFNGNVLLNDTDLEDAQPQTALLVSGPAQALSFSLNTDGSFSYTPAANFNGNDSFTYIAKDSMGASSGTATVNLTVTPVNDAPIANPEEYRAATNTPLSVNAANGVLANDTDVDGSPPNAVAAVTTTTQGGTITLNTDGSFTYVAANNFNGIDTFTYQATDGSLTSNLATVTLNVGPDVAPVAINDADSRYRTSPGTTLDIPAVFGVLGNDTDSDGPTLLAVAGVKATTNNGTVTLNADGSFLYTPQAGFTGVDTFTYQATDSLLTSSLATVTVVVGANAPPVAVDDSSSGYRTTPGTSLNINAIDGVLQNDSDGGDGPTLSAVAGVKTSTNNGTVTLNADGSFVYTPGTGFTGTDTFTYQATDGIDTSSLATVTIAVSANILPTALDDSGYRAVANSPFLVSGAASVLNNDSDGGDGPTLNAVPGVKTTTGSGTVTMSADGSFTYNPRANFTGIDTFTYQATDGIDTSSFATVTINVVTNSAPVVVNDSYVTTINRTLTVPGSGNLSVLANDTDVDGNTLAVFPVSLPTHGSLLLNNDGSFTYTPNANYQGVDFFTYQADDGFVNSNNVATVTLSVVPNAAPIANTETYSVNRNNVITVAAANGVLKNDVDTDPLTANLVTSSSNGVLAFNPDGSFIYQPNSGFSGPTDTFVYRASDGTLNSAPTTVTLSIKTSSAAPTANPNTYSVNANNTLNVIPATGVLANDTDPEGDRLSASIVTGPTKGTLTLNSDGSFNYQPNANVTGIDTFVYKANDGLTDSNLATVTINVGATNNPPVVAVPGSQVVFRNIDLVIASGISISDVDAGNNTVRATLAATNGSLTLSTTTDLNVIDPDGDKNIVVEGSIASINAALTNLRYHPDTGFAGSDTIDITVNDKGSTGNTGPQSGSGTIAVNVTTGPSPVKDINQTQNAAGTGTNSSTPTNLVAAGNVVYFAANDGIDGTELWRSDGTSSGTTLVANINSNLGGSSSPNNLTIVGSTLYFTATDPNSGTELWKTDLVNGTTSLVKNINPLTGSSSPSNLVNVNGTLFFRANDGFGLSLWKTDGTDVGTVKVGTGYSQPGSLTAVNSTLYFTSSNGTQLWKSNGTDAGTVLVKDLGTGAGVTGLIAIGTALFFTAKDSQGIELWRSDGSSAGTARVSDINSGVNNSSPNNLKNLGGTLYFMANNGTSSGLYKSTAAGVVSLVQTLPSAGQAPTSLTVVGSSLFFVVDAGTSTTPKLQLWKSNGSTVGLVKDINPSGNANPASLTNVNGVLLFTANDGTTRIWQSDGTDAGTIPVSGAFTGSVPSNLTGVGSRLFFTADTAATGTELWAL
jgi:ELWxxDGT repeat protein/VCBS repeat-containing protein